MYKSILRVTAILFLFATATHAEESLKDRRERSPLVLTGDILYYTMPVSSFMYPASLGDTDGMLSWSLSIGTTFAVTHGLKYLVGRPRPFQERDERGTSFPSGHTSSTFAAAAFLHWRYGFAYGAPAYALAALTGYSRVWGGWHYWLDVAAGAAIGIIVPYIFTTRYEDSQTPINVNIININFEF